MKLPIEVWELILNLLPISTKLLTTRISRMFRAIFDAEIQRVLAIDPKPGAFYFGVALAKHIKKNYIPLQTGSSPFPKNHPPFCGTFAYGIGVNNYIVTVETLHSLVGCWSIETGLISISELLTYCKKYLSSKGTQYILVRCVV